MGRTETQKGHRLTLRCPSCNRVLRIYLKKKAASPAKLVVIDGSVHQNEKMVKINVRCKCGNKSVFEKQTACIRGYGWRCVSGGSGSQRLTTQK